MLCGSRCAFGVLPPISTPIIPVMHYLGGKRNADGLNKKRANPNERIHPNVLIFRKARHQQPTRCLAEPARCFLLPVRLPAADMELGENRTRLVSELLCGGLTDCYAHAWGVRITIRKPETMLHLPIRGLCWHSPRISSL